MSKDIRSFFVKKASGSNDRETNAKSGTKRALRVIESDSEDDSLIIDKPAAKKAKESKPNAKSSPKGSNEKTKGTPVNISSFFGSSPVQQKQREIKKTDKTPPAEKTTDHKDKEKKKKKKDKEKDKDKDKDKDKAKAKSTSAFTIDSDDGFDESVLMIGESDPDGVSEKESPRKESKKSPKDAKTPVEDLKKTPDKFADDGERKQVRTPGSADMKRNSLLDSEQKRRNAEAYQKYLNRSGPKNLGSKEIPKGTPTCLNGLTFVISGVLDSMEREDAVDLIQKCGGRVTSSISKKTSFIIVGEEAGAVKLEKAKKLGTKQLSEDDLLDLIRSKSNVVEESSSSQSQDNFIESTPKKDTSKYFESGKKRPGDDREASGKKIRKSLDVKAPKFEAKSKKVEKSPESSGYDTAKTSHSQDSDSCREVVSPVGESLWVDKYKPKTTKQIIGQLGEKSNVKKLVHWLETWNKNHLNSTTKKSRPAPWQSQDGSAFKAALLSGPPGVGKTTSVHLVCKELGYDIVEFNASDTRSKKLLQESVSELLRNKSIRGFLRGSDSTPSKHVLVMDEVDGMAGNEDRGGVQELIQVIKNTKVPIICMCNDRSHPKMRSLVNYCYDLRYMKPRVEQIKAAMMSVCYKEGVKISQEALEEIITNANQDVRQVLHNLSLWAQRDKSLSNEQAKKNAEKAKKPLNLGPWDVARKVFSASEHSTMSLREKEELFFQDYSLGPLFVQDTYIRVKPHKAKNDKKAVINLLSKAADSILIGDVVERTIRSENAWNLLPVQAIFSSVLPGHYMEGHVQGQIQFPVWLGKNSKRNRFDRMLQELQTHMRLSSTGSKESVNLDYLHVLKNSIAKPLLRNGAEGVADALQIMTEYNLTKEDVESIMELALWPGRQDVYSSIDSRVKAALTRAYNKDGKAVPFATSVNVKKAKNAVADSEFGEPEEEEESAGSDAETLETDAMIKKGKTKAAKPEKEDGKPKGKKGSEAKEKKKKK